MSSGGDWIAGIHAVVAALEHDIDHVKEVLIEAGCRNPRLLDIEQTARARAVPVRRVTAQALDGIAGKLRHQGVAARYAAAPMLDETGLLALVAERADALVLVLDGVQDPHNLGACLRSAAAAGVSAVVLPRDRAVGITATVRKTSAGAADRLPIAQVANLARCLRKLRDAGIWLYGLEGTAERRIYDIDLRGRVALVVGGEGEGLRRLTREHCDALVCIPMSGAVESLNVSVAAGIALFEVRRQRSAA